MFGRPIEVYSGRGDAPINIFQGSYKTDYPPIRLSYHHGDHYNSVIDPNNPAVGVGLGLPNYEPGLANLKVADRMLLLDAIKRSEQDEIEQRLLEQTRISSELTDTEREIEEAVLAASRAEYLASLFGSIRVPPLQENPHSNYNSASQFDHPALGKKGG